MCNNLDFLFIRKTNITWLYKITKMIDDNKYIDNLSYHHLNFFKNNLCSNLSSALGNNVMSVSDIKILSDTQLILILKNNRTNELLQYSLDVQNGSVNFDYSTIGNVTVDMFLNYYAKIRQTIVFNLNNIIYYTGGNE